MKKNDKNVQNQRPVYVLCPRCEINYMLSREKYCDVCKAELGIGDPSILLPEDDETASERICPICHVNLLDEDEDICIECKKERDEKEKEVRETPDDDEENTNDWEPFGDEDENDIPDGMQEVFEEDEEEDEEEEEEVETFSDEPDDFDFNVDPNDWDPDEEEEDDE